MNQYDFTKAMLSKVRELSQGPLNEDKEEKQKPIAITNEPRFGENVLKHPIETFRNSLSIAAQSGHEDAEFP